MSRNIRIFYTTFLVLLVLAIFAGLSWANTFFVRSHPVEKDFLVPWLAARTFLQYGENPYSEPATQRAQLIFYGHLATEDMDQLRLSIPMPVEFIFFPFALITNYELARSLWMTCLEIALVAMTFLSLELANWKPARLVLPVIMIFSILWIYNLLPLFQSSAVILVALSSVGLLLAMREGSDELAGALMAVSCFKLDVTALLLLYFVWWAIYHRRNRILLGFLMTLTFLLALSFFVVPSWVPPFILGVVSNLKYQPGFTPANLMASIWPVFGLRVGWALTGFILVILFLEWWDVRQKDFRHLLWTASLTLSCTPLLGIQVHPQDFVLLFLPLLLFLTIIVERWSDPGWWEPVYLVMLILFFGFWGLIAWLSLDGITKALPIVFMLVFPFLLVIGLYWMRWWAVRPPRTWSDELP
jgi:hypothetical protein